MAEEILSLPTESKIRVTKQADDTLFALASRISNGEAKDKYIYCLEEDRFYLFENGCFRHIYDIEMLNRISRHMRINHYALHQRKQIIENIKSITYKKLIDFNWSETLNLKNGMVSPYTGELLEHDDMFLSTMRLDYEFNTEIKCELWLKTLNEILENNKDKISLLQEFFGYCLTRDTTQHKAMLLLGESRSGKSTILQTLRAVIGDKNCASVPLKYISNPQYTPMLINKLVNIDTDVSAKAAEFEAEFKTITSGEPVSCNQKFVAAFDFVPFCKIIMAANIFPKITDHSSAFYKRLLLIPCDRVFEDKEQNRNLAKELIIELPGILNWAIEGLQKLKTRGMFEQLDFMRDAVQELEDENNPVNLFFEEHIEIQFNNFIEKGELFDKYKRWCENTKNYILSQARFSTCVYKKFHKETPKDCKFSGGKRIWRNINYVNLKGETPKQEVVTWEE